MKINDVEKFIRTHCKVVLNENGEEMVSLKPLLLVIEEFNELERVKLLDTESDWGDFGFDDDRGRFEGGGAAWKCDREHPENCK